MKIERLYAITVYLLNHGRTPASELARHFEVSLRTIQRDMDSLCLAGIPISSSAGSSGGYEISDRFLLEKHLATSDDYSYIMTALQGLVSATDDDRAKHTLEKVANIANLRDNSIILDFSVLREDDQTALQLLQTAVAHKRAVTFTYTNNAHETRTHCVEPIAVIYRWYAWYLLAFSNVKKDYRTYKLVRMRDLQITDTSFTRDHASADAILKAIDRTDSRHYTELLLKCKESARSRIVEYLHGTVVEEYADHGALLKATVVDDEHLWFGTLLALGDQVEVITPAEVRRRLLKSAEEIVFLYNQL